MGKNSHKYGHDKDGFMVLIPRTTHATGYSIHEGEVSAEYWKQRCLHAESKYDKLKKQTNRAYGTAMPADDDDSKWEALLAQLEEESAALDAAHGESLPSIDDQRLSVGLGLSFGPNKDPKLYRLSDRDGDLSSGEQFVGGEVEIQPGRGFHIGLHWRRK